MVVSLAVIHEGPSDLRSGCGLADRVFCINVDWVEEELLEHVRQWRGFRRNDEPLVWRRVSELAKAERIKAHGHFNGQPGDLDARLVRLALLLLDKTPDRPDAVVLLRDDDGNLGHCEGFKQALEDYRDRGARWPIVAEIAHVKSECWVLAGFDPQNEDEQKRLDELREELGFDPREKAERLTASGDTDKRSAKRVLHELTGGNTDREAECWRAADLATLKQRGTKSRLNDYLGEVEERLVPLFGQQPAAS